jgi:hypothetical protein
MYSHKGIAAYFLVAMLALLLGQTALAQDKNKASQKQEQTAAKVDLNSASEKDLNSLPGVGPATSKKIVSNRPYSSVDDLKKAGVTQSQIEKIRPMVTVSSPGAAESSGVTGKKSAAAESGSAADKTKSRQASSLPQSDHATAPPAPGSGKVWVNLDSKVYHQEGDPWYGKTKHGKYMSETDAQKAGYRPAKKSQ